MRVFLLFVMHFFQNAALPDRTERNTTVWCIRLKDALNLLHNDLYMYATRELGMRIDHLISGTMEEMCA